MKPVGPDAEPNDEYAIAEFSTENLQRLLLVLRAASYINPQGDVTIPNKLAIALIPELDAIARVEAMNSDQDFATTPRRGTTESS